MVRYKIELKYTFHCPAGDLFFALYNPNMMANWIAEKVEFKEATGVFTFHWSEFSESYHIEEKDEKRHYICWKTIDGENKGEHISFRVSDADDAGLSDLYIVDFTDKSEEEPLREGWDKLMKRLTRALSL